MRSSGTFGGGVVFAALAAAFWLPWSLLAAPLIGIGAALALYLALAAGAYVYSIAPRAGRGIGALLAFTAAIGAGFLARGVVSGFGGFAAALALELAVIIGIARTLLHPAAPARVIARELVLSIAGLVLARMLAGPSIVAIALALWGFLLVQSFFFLGGGRSARGGRGDAFEEARRRTLELLERQPI